MHNPNHQGDGSLDHIRYRLVDILEGSQEAFQGRWVKY